MQGIGRRAETLLDIGVFAFVMLPAVAAALFVAGAARIARHEAASLPGPRT